MHLLFDLANAQNLEFREFAVLKIKSLMVLMFACFKRLYGAKVRSKFPISKLSIRGSD
jgi:hypothetical protein